MKVGVGALIVEATETTPFRRWTADTASLFRHAGKGAELNCVYLHVRFSDIVEVSLVVGVAARIIDTVSLKDYRSSPLDAGQFAIERQIECIVEPRAAARFDI